MTSSTKPSSVKKTLGVVHILSEGGHRREYRNLFSHELGLQPVTGRLTLGMIMQLLKASHLLFATVPKGGLYAAWVALLRSCLGKKTCAVTVGNEWWKHPRRHAVSRLALFIFKLLNRLGRFTVLTILPPMASRHHAQAVSDWIYDPQLWDLCESPYVMPGSLPTTELSSVIRESAQGRVVIVFIGRGTLRKGIDEFAMLSSKYKKQCFFTLAGRVDDESKAFADELESSGMLVFDRFISDEELLSLYGIAGYCWCKYASSSDVNSGIFGRSFQLSVPAIVRKGGLLDHLSRILSHEVIHDLDMVSTRENRFLSARKPFDEKAQKLSRIEFIRRLKEKSLMKVKRSL